MHHYAGESANEPNPTTVMDLAAAIVAMAADRHAPFPRLLTSLLLKTSDQLLLHSGNHGWPSLLGHGPRSGTLGLGSLREDLASSTNKDKSLDVLHGDACCGAAYAQWTVCFSHQKPLQRSATRAEVLKEEAPMQVQTNRPHESTVTATTGHHAPTSGWWRPDDDMGPFRYLQQGEIMPSLEGTQTLWILVHELDPLLRVRYRSRQR